MSDEFDWENVKENCIPLKRGRNVESLNAISKIQAKGFSRDNELREKERFDVIVRSF